MHTGCIKESWIKGCILSERITKRCCNGSILAMRGNGIDVAKHCGPAVNEKIISSINENTNREMDEIDFMDYTHIRSMSSQTSEPFWWIQSWSFHKVFATFKYENDWQYG